MTRPTGHSRCTMCIAHFRILQILAKKTQTTLQHNDGRMKRAPDSCASIWDSRPKLLSASLNHFTPLFMLYYLYVCTCMKSPPIWPTLHANSDTLFCLPHSVFAVRFATRFGVLSVSSPGIRSILWPPIKRPCKPWHKSAWIPDKQIHRIAVILGAQRCSIG